MYQNFSHFKNMELIQGDCLGVMKTIKDKSIGAIICDLPYGTTQNKWDSVIPFDLMWKQYNRIIKPNGAIVLNSMQPFTSALINSNLNNFKYCWYWKKNRATGVLNAKKQPLRNVEEICVFNVKKYKPQGLIKYGKQSRNGGKESPNYGKGKTNSYVQKWANYPKQMLEFNSVQRVLHPTQKPIELIEYLVRTYTNEGDTILDNTMGSGTTGVACINTNRNFIGIELNKYYFNIAKKRIKEHQSQLTMF